jgi:hypothetical protein
LETVAAIPEGRLGDFIESRQLTRSVSGEEALRRIEALRDAPWAGTPLSGEAAKVMLRARMSKWDREAAEQECGRRNPHACLAELNAMRRAWT